MVEIDVKLKAKNSSGEQTLFIAQDGEEYWFTLAGKYNGENIQIDFDALTREKFEEIITAMQLILDAPNAGVNSASGVAAKSGD